MKKKLVSSLIALMLVVCQAVMFPLAAAADTWVDDSSYPAGGYWMDDEGYRIEGSDPAPASEMPLVTGEEEPVYSAPASQLANRVGTGATQGTIEAIVSTDPQAVQFRVAADGEVAFAFYVNGKEAFPVYSYRDGVLSVMDAENRYYVTLSSSSGAYLGSASSFNEHQYSIVYDLDGAVRQIQTGTIALGDSSLYTAPIRFTDQNTEYELVGGENAAAQILSYGKSTYTFTYQVFNPQDKKATITNVDERGNVLSTYETTLTYRGGDVIYDLPATIQHDNRTFVKVDSMNRITLNYFSNTLEYIVRYQEEQPISKQPYSVKVNYVDSETGMAIGGDFFNITAQNIENEEIVTLQLPQEIAYYTGDSTLYYQPASETTIGHPATSTDTLVYTVSYKKMAEDAPYTWSVRLVDLATGTVLNTINYPVTVSSSATHSVQPQLTVNGVSYILDSTMQNEYVHNYADPGRVQYIYYNQEGSPAIASYDITVRYMEIGTNSELRSEVHTVAAQNGAVSIPTDATYIGSDGTEYVQLLGQGDIQHSFYSPQRTYTIYYRDINDVQNADTVIVREEVITTETVTPPAAPETTAVTPQTPAEEEIPDEQAPLAPAVGGTGTQTTVITNGENESKLVDEEGVNLSDRAEEEIEDSQAPLSSGLETTNETSEAGNMGVTLVISLIAILIVGGAVAGFFLAKRNRNR